VRADGSVVWVRVDAAVSRRSSDGTALATVGTIQDISAEKEVSLALERNERALKEALRARDEFASIASHELKTPVSNLLMRAELAKRGVFGCRGKERLDDFLDAIESQARALNYLVDEMLDLARIRSGRLSLRREHFDLGDAVTTVVERMRPLLVSSAGGKPPEVEVARCACGNWDRARIEQVLTNLLSNVVRYGAGAPAEVKLDVGDGVVKVKVQDRGKGICKEDLERIFGRFVGGAASASQGGLGVGLYLCRKIVEAHGGTIRADSEVGKGTCFTVELPLAHKGVDAVDVA
jgi:signal transduction histidine kinase